MNKHQELPTPIEYIEDALDITIEESYVSLWDQRSPAPTVPITKPSQRSSRASREETKDEDDSFQANYRVYFPLEEKKEKITIFKGRMKVPPNKGIFASYVEYLGYKQAWELKEQQIACKTR